LLLQTDHVFEMARQMFRDQFGSCAAFGQDDVELLAKHALGELADALLRHGVLLAPTAPCRASACRGCEHDEVTGGDQALMRPSPPPRHPPPANSTPSLRHPA